MPKAPVPQESIDSQLKTEAVVGAMDDNGDAAKFCVEVWRIEFWEDIGATNEVIGSGGKAGSKAPVPRVEQSSKKPVVVVEVDELEVKWNFKVLNFEVLGLK